MAIELYVAHNSDAVRATNSDGLVEFLHDAACANCDVVVGYEGRKFFPCVVCVEAIDDEQDVWIVCIECASGVINPGE